MEEKSVEIPKIKGPLREQDSIRALLELLEQQGMEQEKGDVIRMADHIDSSFFGSFRWKKRKREKRQEEN